MIDDGRWMPNDGKSSHCLWQGELNSNYLELFFMKIQHQHLTNRFLSLGHPKDLQAKQDLPVVAMFVNGSEKNEQSL